MRSAALPLALAALSAILVAFYWDQIGVRLAGESPVIAQVLEGNPEGLQHSSIGIRVLAWRYGIEEWQQHPWLGLGAGSSRYRISESGEPLLMMYDKFWLPHLHNSYLETLYQLGLAGLGLLAAMVWVLARGVAAEYRAGRVPRDLYLFLLAALVFSLVWNLFEYRTIRHDWRFFWIIFAGSAYSFHLRTLLAGAASPGAGWKPTAP
jgi:O-antigen ligase